MKPATVATGYRQEDGTWVIMPKCEDCIKEMMGVYGIKIKGDKS
jgi:hypothetical protein